MSTSDEPKLREVDASAQSGDAGPIDYNMTPIVTREEATHMKDLPAGSAPTAAPHAPIEVPRSTEVKNDEIPQVKIHSAREAVSFLIHSNPENIKRADEMNQEQMARLESYGEAGPTLTFMPAAIGKGINTVTDTIQGAIPAPIANAATAAGEQVSKVAGMAADVINNAPTLLINTIPNSIMSQHTKQLLFVDFNNTLRSFFHTNILAMPYIFNQTGVVMGLIMMVVVSLMCDIATELFLMAKYDLPDPSRVVGYGDVPRLTFGDWYPTFNIFYGVIHLIGFQVFAAKNTQVMLRAVFNVQDSGRGYILGMIIPSAIALPLVLMKQAHNQRPLSIISNTLVIISVICLVFYFPYDAFDVSMGPKTVPDTSVALGVVVYAFTGIGSVIPVEKTMPAKRYKSLLRPAVSIAFLALALFGITGYVSYGGNTCAVITMSLQEGSTKTAVSVMLFIASIAIIPQQAFPFVEVIDRRFIGLTKVPDYFQLNANFNRICSVFACAVVAYYVPYYGLLSAISGAIGCSVLGFIVPGLLERKRRMRQNPALRWWEHLLVFAFVGFGFFIMLVCTVMSVYKIIDVVDQDYVATCF